MSTTWQGKKVASKSNSKTPARPSGSAAHRTGDLPKARTSFFKGLFKNTKVKRQDLISFSRALSTLLDAGIGISAALELLAEERKGTALEPVINQLKHDLSTGTTFSAAMAKHPTVFPKVYIKSISAADRGANLSETLTRSAGFLDAASSAITQAKRAMIYPILIIIVGIGIVFMLLTVSLPQMIGLFDTLGADLPMPTRVLIALSNFIREDGKYALPIMLLGLYVAWKFLKSAAGRLWLHGTILKVPVLNSVIISSDLARSSSALAALSESGLPLPDALDVAKDTVSNEIIRNGLIEAQKGLMAGEGIARPLSRSKVFPRTFVQTLKVAEDTGTLDANLRRMADLYAKEASDRVKAMASLVEPLATIGVALAVGFIAMAVIMPMYTVLGSIEK